MWSKFHLLLLAFIWPPLISAFVVPNPASFQPTRILHEQQPQRCRRSMVSSSADSPTLPETSPLPPHTFAGSIEKALIEKFGEEDIQRILKSWRLLEQGYEHREYVGPSNMDPKDSNCHQHAPSYVPGLFAQEFWNVEQFSWAAPLQAKYKEIKEEFTRVALQNADNLQKEGNNIWSGALTEDASSYGMGWKTLGMLICVGLLHSRSATKTIHKLILIILYPFK